MEQEIKTVLKKTVKIAGVTCFALGSAALVASGAALKALVEGGKYARDSVKKILAEETAGEAAQVAEAGVIPAEEPEDTAAEENP